MVLVYDLKLVTHTYLLNSYDSLCMKVTDSIIIIEGGKHKHEELMERIEEPATEGRLIKSRVQQRGERTPEEEVN